MKKTAGILIKIFFGLVILILLLLFVVPIVFKDKIRIKVEQVINESVNATVKFENYKLGFFRNFPNLSFSLKDVSVTGAGMFKNDTLAGFQSLDLVFNLSSLMKKSGYEIKSVIIDKAVVNAIVPEQGKANWEVMKDTTTTKPVETKPSSGMKVRLEKFAILNSSISYVDEGSNTKAYLKDLNFYLTGDMAMNETDFEMSLKSAEFTFEMDGMKYLNKVVLDSKIGLHANLDKMKFTFLENYLSINDLKVNFSGTVDMPGKDIATDIKFGTARTSFKTLLSLVPAAYMKDYKKLEESGEFVLNGTAKGIYSAADSTLPDISLAISVTDGSISYPSLPEKIKNIRIKSDVLIDGKSIDKSIVNVEAFHMELAGNPFDMSFTLKTPVSDPEFKGSVAGKIDLAALSKAVPMDSIKLSGVLDMSVQMDGKMSMIEKSQYDRFKASGNITAKNMVVSMIGYPEVKISEAVCEFTPAFLSLTAGNSYVGGKSDFSMSGKLENYIPYVFNNKTIKGNIKLNSKLLDVSDILSKMGKAPAARKDTVNTPPKATAPVATETVKASSVPKIPENLNLDFDAVINEFVFDKIKAQNVKGHIIIRNGVLSLREAAMSMLEGTLAIDADFDTRNVLKPLMKADLNVQNIGIKDIFNMFNTVKALAPASKGIEGKISAKLNYESLLGNDMLPVANSINGSGNLKSDEITLLESKTFDLMKEVLKLGDRYNSTFKNIDINFKISDGRVYVSPFDVKTGNLKMNISGDQGLDQTLNYIVKTEIPRADLGNSVNSFIDNLSSQASALGFAFKPSDFLRVNVKVTGTFSKPEVAPFFGNTSGETTGGAKETIKNVFKQTLNNAGSDSQASKLVSDAEEQGGKLREEAAVQAENIRKEGDVQAQKLIDESSTKGTFAKLAAQKGADIIKKDADKRATQVTDAADAQAKKLVEDAKQKSNELLKK